MGRSRGGLTSKIHAVVDSNGLPVRLALSPGEALDVRLAGKLVSRLKPGSMLLAERGYDADWITGLAMKKGGVGQHPPEKQSLRSYLFLPYLYRARNQVERFFNRIKQCRRVATRYDRLAGNDSAFVQLASIRLYASRAHRSTSQCTDFPDGRYRDLSEFFEGRFGGSGPWGRADNRCCGRLM